MSPGKAQRKGITFMELLKIFPDDATAEAWFVEARWPEGVTCPHCGSANVKTGANHHSMPFRCREKGCAKPFSTRTGTVTECSNLGFQLWAIAIFLFATNLKAISSMKPHRDLGVTQQTAWLLAHRIRETWQDASARFARLPGFHPFDGPIEADETYVGGKRKNMSHEKRKQLRGRGGGGGGWCQGPRNRSSQCKGGSRYGLSDTTRFRQTPGNTVYTDAALAYRGMTSFEYQAVHHGVGEYVRDVAHTNGIESFGSMLKRGYVGIFHKSSAKHLDRYGAEFAGRHNIRLLDTPGMMLREPLKKGG